MSGYIYQTMPKMEANSVQESTSLAMNRAGKVIDNLRFRLSVFQSDLKIEQDALRGYESSDIFTSIASLSDEVFSALRFACNELNAISVDQFKEQLEKMRPQIEKARAEMLK